jgi:hypothetical protein
MLAQQAIAHVTEAAGTGVEHRVALIALRDYFGSAEQWNTEHLSPPTARA